MQIQRTQIYLPEDLRHKIDRQRRQTGESLAEYLRKAAEKRIEADRKRKTNLKKLAEEFIGSSRKSDKEINEWLDWVKEERRLSDEVREDRLEKAISTK